MSRYAVIDFGSNTIRLCIYALPDVPSDSLTKKDITVLLNYKEMAGISSYVKNGKLSEKGIKKASRILREQIERASYFSPDAVRVFATAVLRNAKNSESAKQAIEKNCGVPITLLTNEEEALLGLAGASLDGSIETATLVDIGGGSTELTALSKGKLQAATSLPLGSLSSFTQYVSGILPSTSEMEAIAEAFDALYADLPETVFEHKELVGIGGAIRSAAKVYGDVFREGKRSSELLPEQLDEILAAYSRDPDAFMIKALQTIPDRIHTFIPGCVIIARVFALTGAHRLRIAKHGVREGFLIERILGNVA